MSNHPGEPSGAEEERRKRQGTFGACSPETAYGSLNDEDRSKTLLDPGIHTQEGVDTEELNKKGRTRERGERLRIMGQLAGGVAHELRNPLGVIQNAFLFIEETTQDQDEDTREALDEIRRGIANAERVISEFLDFGRGMTPADPEWCDLPAVAAGAISPLIVPGSIHLEIRSDNPPPRCYCDTNQVGRILHNLIRNGIEAMPAGGKLDVHCKTDGKDALVEVRDEGCGIPRDEFEEIFQPLVSKKAKGIGLGLAISRRYAEENKGSLEVESEVGEGSVFRLVLPSGSTEGPDDAVI